MSIAFRSEYRFWGQIMWDKEVSSQCSIGVKDRRKENPGEAASKRAASEIAAETPGGPGLHGFSDFRPQAAPGANQVPERNEPEVQGRPIPETPDKIFMIIFPDERREPKIHRFRTSPRPRRSSSRCWPRVWNAKP